MEVFGVMSNDSDYTFKNIYDELVNNPEFFEFMKFFRSLSNDVRKQVLEHFKSALSCN